MWLRHWKLTRDPFSSHGGNYVATPPHAEAASRLVDAIRACERSTVLRGGVGSGKSMVLAQALFETRSSGLRIAKAVAPLDGVGLYDGLVRSLRLRVAPSATPAVLWRMLTDAARLIAAQRARLILAIDGADAIRQGAERTHLERLESLGSHVSIVRLERDAPESPDVAETAIAIQLRPLTRLDTSIYLNAKLRRAGRDEPTFAEAAVSRLHRETSGLPLLVDRWAGLALRTCASERLSLVPAESIDALVSERDALPIPEGLSISA